MKGLKEFWRDVSGYEGLYKVSSFGRLKGFKNGNWLLVNIMYSSGYDLHLLVRLVKDGKRRSVFIHRLVAEAFHKNPDNKPLVLHQDGNRENNHASNLKWIAYDENLAVGWFGQKSGKHPMAKEIIMEDKVDGSRRPFDSVTDGSKTMGINLGNISQACKGKRKSAGGFLWEFAFPTLHKVQQVDVLHEPVRGFNTMHSASKATGIPVEQILAAVEESTKTGNFYWTYL